MSQLSPDSDLFKRRLRDFLFEENNNFQTLKIKKKRFVYTDENKNDNIYFIENGYIKLLTLAPTGKQCLIDIYNSGDVFGELCLSASVTNRETAVAMVETYLKVIPCNNFLSILNSNLLLEDFVKYLVAKLADQQEINTNFVTLNSEQRLGNTLIRLAGKMGERYTSHEIIIKHKITHDELSEMVGTTRSRVSQFMGRFQKRNLIEISEYNFIIIRETKLTNYLKKFG